MPPRKRSPKYNLNQFQALAELKEESHDLEIPMLEGIPASVVYELGFATAVQHLENLILPDPMEVDVITVALPEEVDYGPVRTTVSPNEVSDASDEVQVEVTSLLPTITEKKNSEDDNA